MVITMNSEHYPQQPQIHGLPMEFRYSDDEDSAQTHLISCDGLPRPQQRPLHFMTSNPPTANTFSNTYNLVNPMSMSSPLTWTDPAQAPPSFDDQTPNEYNYYSPNITGNEFSNPNNPFLRGMNRMDFQIPRCMPEDMRMYDNNMSMDAYEAPPSMYMMENQRSMGFNSQDHSRDFARLSISPGPKIEDCHDGLPFDKPPPFMSGMPSSETSDDGVSSREMTAVVDVEEQAAGDEPYAKLIYRALMSRPNRSMVLQEIYQWFRDNTAKGSSDSKGWMNSIRHNLSMNAVCPFISLNLPQLLTRNRHSRKPSARFPVTRLRNPPSGFWKTSRSKMACRAPLATEARQPPPTRNSQKQIRLLSAASLSEEKQACMQRKPNQHEEVDQ